MPSTTNLRRLSLCFSESTSKQKESPPISATAPSTSSHHHHNHGHFLHNPLCPSPSSINMIKNFNSLYDPTPTFHDNSLRFSSLSTITTIITSFESEPEIQPKPTDFATAFSSQRFFFSSPRRSNSLIEDTDTKSNSRSSPLSFMDTHQNQGFDGDNNKKKNNKRKKKKEEDLVFNGSVAVPTYSTDPYLERSMQEMAEARPELMDGKSNWNVSHKLLLCYLALNPKSTHKFILGDFVDLLVSLMPF